MKTKSLKKVSQNSKFIVNCQLSIVILLLSACSSKNAQYDASGVFEATEIIVSAKGSGEILQFAIEEGQQVAAQQVVGLIDTTQLHLKKVQLQASMQAMNSRRVNVASQIAVLKQQL